jgi:hypothetical protein
MCAGTHVFSSERISFEYIIRKGYTLFPNGKKTTKKFPDPSPF